MLRECGWGSGGQDAAGQGASHGARRARGASQKKEKQRFLKLIQKISKQEPGRLFDRQVGPSILSRHAPLKEGDVPFPAAAGQLLGGQGRDFVR